MDSLQRNALIAILQIENLSCCQTQRSCFQVAGVFDKLNTAVKHGLVKARRAGLRTQTEEHPAARIDSRQALLGQMQRTATDNKLAVQHFCLQNIHRRRADKGRYEGIRRMMINFRRRSNLLNFALIHDGDTMCHRHRLNLVMRYIHHRRLEQLMNLYQLGACLLAQLGIKV